MILLSTRCGGVVKRSKLSRHASISMEKPLVLLDIDNTLAFVHDSWLHRAPSFSFRLSGECFHCYIRPGVFAFVAWLQKHYRVGVWTAADRQYAACVLRRIFGFRWRRCIHCFFHRRHCSVSRAGSYIKDLRRLDEWLPEVPPKVWLVDDNPIHARFNIRHAPHSSRRVLACNAYYGHHHDIELVRIQRFMNAICV